MLEVREVDKRVVLVVLRHTPENVIVVNKLLDVLDLLLRYLVLLVYFVVLYRDAYSREHHGDLLHERDHGGERNKHLVDHVVDVHLGRFREHVEDEVSDDVLGKQSRDRDHPNDERQKPDDPNSLLELD